MSKVDVVVIDDDAGIRWVLQEILSLRNISCQVAGSGLEGLQLVSRHEPRLAIVDIKLGAMNGLDVARRIHANNPDTQILFITGYLETITGKIDQDIPLLGVMEKPFNLEEMIRLVESAFPGSAGAEISENK